MQLIEFEIDLINKMNDVIGKEVIKPINCLVTIDLEKIISYRQASVDDSSDDESLGQETLIYLTNGEIFIVKYKYQDFHKLMKYKNI